MTELAAALNRLFDRHRVVFWTDDKAELRAEFDALDLPGVEKIVLANNEFGVKYRILRQEPEQKFLIYREAPSPADLDNWLLDVQLASGEFRADQVALWLTELGLDYDFADVIRPHAEFFKAAKRRQALRSLLKPDDTPRDLRLKLLAVCTGAEPHLDDILTALLDDLAGDADEAMRLVARTGLDGFLWQQVQRVFGYTSPTPSLADFVIALFKAGYALALGEQAGLRNDARLFLSRWQDSVRHQAGFAALSAQCADIMGLEHDLTGRDYRTLVEVELFELVDRKVLAELVGHVAARTVGHAECVRIVRARRRSYWYRDFEHAYAAVEAAAHFLTLLDQVSLTVQSLEQGVAQYINVWYQVDQLYRQFIYRLRQSGQPTLLHDLLEQVDNRYNNLFLLPLNDQWQQCLDAEALATIRRPISQAEFYNHHVAGIVAKGNKLCVVISDGLRYEIGEELQRRVRQEDRFDATLDAALTLLPSFTQLGMAALLPHKALSLADDGDTVLVDGVSSRGTENRRKILAQALHGRGTAIQADDLLNLSRDDSRTLMRDHDVVYVYHNRIDKVGDTRDTEERVFDAVETALEELVRILKKLANANFNNVIVTADHGFLYQHRALDASDFSGQAATGAPLIVQDRRYVVGRNLDPRAPAGRGFMHFPTQAFGLRDDLELLIPKSINRLRVKGAGSRYVHGGATLQEIVVPVLRVNKKRQSDVETVEVDLIPTGGSAITTGQLSVALFQVTPVEDKVSPRRLRAAIYSRSGVLMSDVHDLVFDLTSRHDRDREVKVQFVLSKRAEDFNNQDVELRLEEPIAETSHYRLHKSFIYRLRRSITADFDL